MRESIGLHKTSTNKQQPFKLSMSTAWYKSNVTPKLIQQWTKRDSNPTSRLANTSSANRRRILQVWSTTCIVTNFGRQILVDSSDKDAMPDSRASHAMAYLVNPANPQLSGVSQFPYFPKGGPVPAKQPSKDLHHIMGYVSTWGGMEVGDGMMFSAVVVDGLVHQMGGQALQYELSECPIVQSPDVRCPHGQSVITKAHNELSENYDAIIHTAPPFYKFDGVSQQQIDAEKGNDGSNLTAEDLLRKCYESSLSITKNRNNADYDAITAIPLLGAGCRGFPQDVAIDIASQSAINWLEDEGEKAHDSGSVEILAFAIPSSEIHQALVKAIDDYHTNL